MVTTSQKLKFSTSLTYNFKEAALAKTKGTEDLGQQPALIDSKCDRTVFFFQRK